MTSKAISFSSRPHARGRVYTLIVRIDLYRSLKRRQVIRVDSVEAYECQECLQPDKIPQDWVIIGQVDTFYEALQWLADSEDV